MKHTAESEKLNRGHIKMTPEEQKQIEDTLDYLDEHINIQRKKIFPEKVKVELASDGEGGYCYHFHGGGMFGFCGENGLKVLQNMGVVCNPQQ